MYSIVRLILVGIPLVGLLWFLRKKGKAKRKYVLLSLLAAVGLVSVLALFPFENTFYTFSSAETVYRYYHPGTREVPIVVEGEQCTFVVGKNLGSEPYCFVPKTEKGWKIDRSLLSPSKLAVQDIVDGVLIHVYRYRNSSDYFIMVCDLEEGIADVSDSNGAAFQEMVVGKSLNSNPRKQYYAHLSAPDPDYWIEVNGTVIKPFETPPSGD